MAEEEEAPLIQAAEDGEEPEEPEEQLDERTYISQYDSSCYTWWPHYIRCNKKNRNRALTDEDVVNDIKKRVVTETTISQIKAWFYIATFTAIGVNAANFVVLYNKLT